MNNQPKKTKPLPAWIIVTAKDPKLKKAIEKHLAKQIKSNDPERDAYFDPEWKSC